MNFIYLPLIKLMYGNDIVVLLMYIYYKDHYVGENINKN